MQIRHVTLTSRVNCPFPPILLLNIIEILVEGLFKMIEGIKGNDETYHTHDSGALNDAEVLLCELE